MFQIIEFVVCNCGIFHEVQDPYGYDKLISAHLLYFNKSSSHDQYIIIAFVLSPQQFSMRIAKYQVIWRTIFAYKAYFDIQLPDDNIYLIICLAIKRRLKAYLIFEVSLVSFIDQRFMI